MYDKTHMAYETTCTNVSPFYYFIPATNSQLGLSLRSLVLQGFASSPMGGSISSLDAKGIFFFSDKSSLAAAPNLLWELYKTKDCSLCFVGLRHLCALQSLFRGIFGGRVSQFWLGCSRVVHHHTQAPPGASSLLHLLGLVGLTQEGEGTSVV